MENETPSATNTDGILNGHLIGRCWKVQKKIGQGAFGEIYLGKNIISGEFVAIKFEKVDTKKQVLRVEVSVIRKLQSTPNVVHFITCGRYNQYNYMVMELLGENLSELRRKQPAGKFSICTTCRLGVQIISALEAIHDLGFLHRDVKPSNFAMGLNAKSQNPICIDFGLARKYVGSDGTVRPAREGAGFRGTARYASINSHHAKDLGRVDDLWSVLYLLIEFLKGQLPWRRIKDKDEITPIKIQYNTPELVQDLPKEFEDFWKHLKKLDFEDKPDYDYLKGLLQSLMKDNSPENHAYDWELEKSANLVQEEIMRETGPQKNSKKNTIQLSSVDSDSTSNKSEKGLKLQNNWTEESDSTSTSSSAKDNIVKPSSSCCSVQ